MIVFLLGIFIFGFSVLVAIPESFPHIKGLIEGPVFSENIIQGKTTSYDRSGSNYYVDINNQHFHVPNSKWWQTFAKGERIAYAYNPYSGGFSESIFHPNEINFTLPGMIIITDLILLWGMTIWASIGGYVYFIFHKPIRDYHYPSEISSYATPQFQHHQAENSNKQSSCLPVLGIAIGLAALMLLIWKRLFAKAAK